MYSSRGCIENQTNLQKRVSCGMVLMASTMLHEKCCNTVLQIGAPGIPSVSTRFSLSIEMSRLTRDGTAEPVSRGQILRHARRQGNINFPCSADHEQDRLLYSSKETSTY